MTDLRTSLERMRDGFAPPDDAYGRLVTRRARRRRGQRLGTAFVALAVAAAGVAVAARAFLGEVPRRERPGQTQLQYDEGWTELPPPPERFGFDEVSDVGGAVVWTGSEVIVWGGCAPEVRDECVALDSGAAFDPTTDEWTPIPPAPASAGQPHAVWTGREAIFIDEETFDGVAFDPVARTWRTLPHAPIVPRFGAVYLWTGSEAIVWGGGDRGDSTIVEGAAYDPVTDSWTRIADGPVGLNAASAVWTGQEMIVFGSAQNDKNWAATDTAVGAAYDPALERWRELPPSELSPQASSVVWTGEVMVAWDYEVRSQEYDPKTDAWTPPQKMPLEFDECYPNSVLVGGRVFAFFCGRAALYELTTSQWSEIGGGPLEPELPSEAYGRRIKLWRFASLVPAGDVVFLMMEGITLDEDGVACYGCSGSPHSFWVYRPPVG